MRSNRCSLRTAVERRLEKCLCIRACVREAGLCVGEVAHVAIGDDWDAECRLDRL